ncbi:MAG TPA: tRNA (guanosine(37)-N1)-methyltransferase TrmD [Candidatus Paceibacterota bacterium]|nr:tRNA (guanosine(37)-N1)-methyltransferase TrmD [Candidatus Paceibacterota bacterium]HPT39995.1 tRNA (guanosine(37)-N1)-methyltransferase TrmD [Candidatus Paceibacterota bacterium]
MIKFNIITIFPEAFESYFNSSLLKKAQEKGLIKINLINLRDFADDKHKKVDDRPFGGGPGMVMKLEPIYRAVKKYPKARVVLFSVKGKRFDQKMAEKLVKIKEITLICGHYEGVDERVAKYLVDEEISFGDFVLSGGELPAMLTVDAVARLIPGFMSKEESIETKRIKSASGRNIKGGELPSYPAYTRPEVFYPNAKNKKISWKVPEVLLSGYHQKIEEWRLKNKK